MLLVTFHAFWGATTKVGRMSEGLTIKTLSDGSGILEFFPSDYGVAQFTKLEYFTHVSSWFERYYEYRVLVYHSSSCYFISCYILFALLILHKTLLPGVRRFKGPRADLCQSSDQHLVPLPFWVATRGLK